MCPRHRLLRARLSTPMVPRPRTRRWPCDHRVHRTRGRGRRTTGPGTPRPYAFLPVARAELENGLTIPIMDLPGRPLVSASMVVPVGAADEPAADGGAAVLAVPRTHRGHRALRRRRADRGDRAARRLHPCGGRLGRDEPRASTCHRPVSRRRSSCSPRSCCARLSRVNETPAARRATQRPAAGPCRPAGRADDLIGTTTRRPRPTTGRRRPSRDQSRRSMTPSLAAPTSASSTPPGPRSSSAGTSAIVMSWRRPPPVRRLVTPRARRGGHRH